MNPDNKNDKGILLEVGTNEVEFLIIHLGSQRYGINVAKVCQILLYDKDKIAHLPNQHDSMVGIMRFRDKSISVIDLRTYLKIDNNKENLGTDLLLVTEFNQRITGFVIDSVDRIERCGWNQFESIAETVCQKNEGSVVGSITLPDGIIIILDLETILSSLDPSMAVDYYKDQIVASQFDRSDISIVYCEDSLMVQKMLVKTLEQSGFKNFKVFGTGADGYEYLKSAPVNSVDIILSDIEMPKMDGLTLCKNVKALPQYGNIPFIFFSSTINDQMEKKCRSVGGDACFSKPEIHNIVQAVEDLLNNRDKK